MPRQDECALARAGSRIANPPIEAVKACDLPGSRFDSHFAENLEAAQGVGQSFIRARRGVDVHLLVEVDGVRRQNDLACPCRTFGDEQASLRCGPAGYLP